MAGNVNGVATGDERADAVRLWMGGGHRNRSSRPERNLFVDANGVGNAVLGKLRPDVAQAFGRSDYSNSGWSFQMSTAGLSIGPHSVTATAAGSSSSGPLPGNKVVNIQ